MNDLSIATASNIQTQALASKIDYAVAKKTLDAQRDQGQAAISLLQSAVQMQTKVTAGGLDVTT